MLTADHRGKQLIKALHDCGLEVEDVEATDGTYWVIDNSLAEKYPGKRNAIKAKPVDGLYDPEGNPIYVKENCAMIGLQNTYSQIFSTYLDQGINNHDATIYMSIGNQIYDEGKWKDIDKQFGGGATAMSRDMNVAYTVISGNSHFGSQSKYNEIPEPIWGDKNRFMNSIIHVSPTDKINIVDTPEWILVHELVGHGIPWMIIEQPNLSSAITNYNKVRREVGLSERFEDPNHYKYVIFCQE